MTETKERILDLSLDLFSQKGYSAVSIRDICKHVKIKESSVYYHFKNKQAIFDELLCRFQKTADAMIEQLEASLMADQKQLGDEFYMSICDRYFENYLMDDFCNKVMRLMLIEQFNNKNVKRMYDYWMFIKPLEFQSNIFQTLMKIGLIAKSDSEYISIKYYTPIFFFAQKWLFSGELSEENKSSFRKEAYKHIQLFFSEIGGI